MSKNLISEMKERIAKSGSSKKEILYFAPDSVKRVRFLQELDAGKEYQFHNDYNTQTFEPCKDPEDHENCKLCEDGVAITEMYAWSVWDYDSNAVRLILTKATGVSPIPALIEMYEEFGTITDRDYKIKKVGKGTGSSFVITPLDKSRFRNNKAKPFSDKQIQEIFDNAYKSTTNDSDDDDDDEEVVEKKSKKSSKKKEKSLRDKFEELSFEDLKEIALEIGLSKKEVRAFDDEEELIDELFDNYEESDLEDLLEEFGDDDDE